MHNPTATEVWKTFQAEDWAWKVRVSNKGNIQRMDSGHWIDLEIRTFHKKHLKVYIKSKGKDKLGQHWYHAISISSLVAKLFLTNRDGRSAVSYKDGDRTNCAAHNLAWSYHAEFFEPKHNYRMRRELSSAGIGILRAIEYSGSAGVSFVSMALLKRLQHAATEANPEIPKKSENPQRQKVVKLLEFVSGLTGEPISDLISQDSLYGLPTYDDYFSCAQESLEDLIGGAENIEEESLVPEMAEENERKELVHKALSKLPLRHALAIKMHFGLKPFEARYNYMECAQQFNISREGFRQRLEAAYIKFRKALGELNEGMKTAQNVFQ